MCACGRASMSYFTHIGPFRTFLLDISNYDTIWSTKMIVSSKLTIFWKTNLFVWYNRYVTLKKILLGTARFHKK